jgi:uncharacterized delta-60 repeat protein
MRQRRTFKGIAVGLVVLGCSAGTAFAGMGDLDPGFSGDGKLIYDVADNGRPDAVAIDSQGRILVAGNVNPPGADTGDFAVARFLPSGIPDASFSGDGFLAIPVGVLNSANDGQAVTVDSADRVYVGGGSGGANGDWTVARVTPAGGLDGSYGGGDGIASFDTGDTGDVVAGVRLDGAGRVVIGGVTNSDFAVARFTTAGVIDTTFGGGDGWEAQNVNHPAASTDSAAGLVLDSAGRPIVAGFTRLVVGEENFAVMRFTADGLLDTSFSNDIPTPGRHIALMSSETGTDLQDVGTGIALAPGDRPVVSGYAEIASSEDVAVLKLDAAGQPDPTFSGDGKAYADLGQSDRADGLAIDGAGRVAYVGSSTPLAGDTALAVGRLSANGAPDPSFSGDGSTTADIGPGTDFGQVIAIDRAGRLVATAYNGPFATAEWALARFEGVPRCGGKIPTLTGTPGKDKLKGTKRKDVISGGAGKDTISGLGGADVLCGEDGKDRLAGGGGNDRLIGGKGNDNLVGGKGKDKLKGGKGKDKQKQ